MGGKINSEGIGNKTSLTKLINQKMQCLDDFGICSKHDKNMKSKLLQAVADNPDKDPRQVLDYYCRPLIQAKVFSW